jgi:glycerate kinase
VKVVIAPNALKGTLSAQHAASAVARGAKRAGPALEVLELPIADGGDGTRDVLLAACGGELFQVDAHDPLGRALRTHFALVDGGRTALLDVAAASGLALLGDSERNPLTSSSFGTGELVRAALASGCERVVIGLGGSATVEGGLGLLAALGSPGLDAAGRPVPLGGGALPALVRFDLAAARALLAGRELICLCDVETRLTGPDGARLFAAQKGADEDALRLLDAGLEQLALCLEAHSGQSVRDLVSGGAAGGIAATLSALLGARLVSGIDFVLDQLGFDDALAECELVITAEGRLDRQSLFNKGPFGVARRARAAGVPTLLLAGAIADDLDLAQTPFAAALSIAREPLPFAAARGHAAAWLETTAEQALRLYLSARAKP